MSNTTEPAADPYNKDNYLNIWMPDPQLKTRLRVRAAEQDMSMSEYIRAVLERELAE